MGKIKKYIYIVVCAMCCLATATSCVKQDIESTNRYDGDKGRLAISLKSAANYTVNADEIQTVRCIIFTTGNRLVGNKLYTVEPGISPCVISTEAAIGRNDFYIVCNETEELGKELEKVTAPDQIKQIRFTPPVTGITNPVPMYSQLIGTQITKAANGSIDITVDGITTSTLSITTTRIVSKLGMTVIKNIPSGETNFSITKLSYRICHLPKYSLLAEGGFYPQGEGWAPEIQMVGEGSIGANSNGDYQVADGVCSVPTGVDAIRFPVPYIPEHVLQSAENPNYCTYLLIEAECLLENSLTPIRTIYRMNLGKMPPTDLNIHRNVNYQIYATIRGLGATGFYAQIVPVDEYDLPITWTPFEGYAIVSEHVTDYGSNTNIGNIYSQYSGILKIVKNKQYNDACFRYGSVIALSSPTTSGAFNASTDILWQPEVAKTTPITSWNDVQYISSGDVSQPTHTLENIRLGKGDPCRLVGLSESEIAAKKVDNGTWRMPTQAEMQWLETARNRTADARGFYSFSYLLTPFNGYRSATGEMVPNNATSGHYWSATNTGSFVFEKTNTATIAADNPQKAYGIRCIRTDIPQSVLSVPASPTSGYLGGTLNIGTSSNANLIPHWKMELADPSADGAFISLGKTEGSSKEQNSITIQPLPNPYQKHTYYIVVKGYGLDGVVHEQRVGIAQTSLVHLITANWTSNPTLAVSEGHYRIPKSGAELEFRIKVTPDPYEAYYPDFDNTGLWQIQCEYYTDKLNIELGSPAKRNEVSKITIKSNTWGHILGLKFRVQPVDPLNYPPYRFDNDYEVFIQEKD